MPEISYLLYIVACNSRFLPYVYCRKYRMISSSSLQLVHQSAESECHLSKIHKRSWRTFDSKNNRINIDSTTEFVIC